MPEASFESFLEQLNSRDPEEAWRLFLNEHSTTILNVVRHIEHDSENVPDCFQFVCERLSADSFRRLRKFRAGGAAVFSTWLRAVVRNLCLDWRRKQFGRHRLFKSISRLSGFDQEVFRHLYERRVSFEETFESLRSSFPNLTHSQLNESSARINRELTTRQRRLLDAQHSSLINPTNITWGEVDPAHDVQDPAPSPEAQAVFAQRARALRRALAQLPQRERLLIRLRFEQELTLEQVAKLMDLGNAQRVERQLKAVLMQLRKALE